MKPDSQSILERRLAMLTAVFAAFLMAILAKLWLLQIVDVEKYRDMARNNRTRLVRDRAQRGRILDRNLNPLAVSKPSFSIYLIPEDCPRSLRKTTIYFIADLLHLDRKEVFKRYRSRKTPTFIPRKIVAGVTFKDVVTIEARKYLLPGILIKAENIRYYPEGSVLCHLLGYVGEISERQIKSGRFENYSIGDTVGKTGIESVFESVLNGRDGYRWVEVDSTGRIRRTLRTPKPKPAHPGRDLVLSIDLELQKAVEEYLEPWNGAILVMDPRNGELLAMTSHPGYDPNWFAAGINRKNWTSLIKNPKHPLINRAIQISESPGSVFKIVTASAGLKAGTLTEQTTRFCNGTFDLSGSKFHCWKRTGHGTVDLVHALEGSCNVFFYQEGLQAGIDAISSMAKNYGLGQKTQIQLPNEVSGFIPDREWKLRVKKESWWPGETVSVAIGQGGVTTTPIQLLNLISAAANRGTVFRPKIIHDVLPAADKQLQSDILKDVILHKIELKPGQWDLLLRGLREVVAGKHGTARVLNMKDIHVFGKTGTAQVISRKALKRMGYGPGKEIPEKYRDNNWFAGAAPYEDPRVAVLIFIENGGKAGARAKVKIAKKIFRKWAECYHYHAPTPKPSNGENQ